MEQPNGHVCPECGAPRATDKSPSCACGRRAADALRDNRTAEAAAAEDFDPLRIRPYVDVDRTPGATGTADAVDAADTVAATGATGVRGASEAGGTADGTDAGTGEGGTVHLASVEGEGATMRIPRVDATTWGAGADGTPRVFDASGASTQDGTVPTPGSSHVTGPAEAETRAVPAVEATMRLRPATLPTPPAPRAGRPNASDLSLFESGGDGPSGTPGRAGAGEDGARGRAARGRRRPGALLAVSGAVVAVVAAAGYASGLFSYESPARDGAAAQDVRESIPDGPAHTARPSSPPATASSSVPPESAAAGASPSRSASPSPSPSPSATGASPTPSPSDSGSGSGTGPGSEPPAPTQTAATVQATATPQPAAVLRRGDQGPEVTELQQRLARIHLYTGRIDGVFGQRLEKSVRTYQWARGITSDGLGVYGPATRARLESEPSFS